MTKGQRMLNNKGIATIAIILIVAGVVVAVGGTIGGIVGYNAYQEKKHEEEVQAFLEAIDKARNDSINGYNDRVEQVMSELTFTDENGNIVTLDNNRNIDSMNNVVNAINTIINDINNDTLLSQEQKDALILAFNEKLNSVNARITAVDEENRIAEEKSKKESETKKTKQVTNSDTSQKNLDEENSSSVTVNNGEKSKYGYGLNDVRNSMLDNLEGLRDRGVRIYADGQEINYDDAIAMRERLIEMNNQQP